MTISTAYVSERDIADFDADGVVILRGLFKEWVKPLSEGIEKLMTDPGPYERSYSPTDGSAPFFQDLCNWQRIDAFRQFIFDSPAGEAGAALMQSSNARFFHDHVLVKEAGSSIVTPWHQDMPYYCVDGQKSVSFWIPLDSVPETTALRCVAGSHKWGQDLKPKRFDGTDLYDGDDSVEVPDIDGNPDKYDVKVWAMEPGDAVAFNFRTIHGAAANVGMGTRRRAFSARWVGDDAVFVDREGKGSPPLEHLTLKTGEPLEGPDFPVAFGD